MTRITLMEALDAFGYSRTTDFTAETLKRDYRKLAMKHHPDHGGSAEAFDRVTRARERLLLVIKDREAYEPKAEQPREHKHAKGDRCGHPTKSGPCYRPFGHPTNHASKQNLDTKAANFKARKAAQKGA